MVNTPQEYLNKIITLLKHNRPHIDAKLLANINDVIEVMNRDSKLMADGFNELCFWFGQGYASRTMPETFYNHTIRYVERGRNACMQGVSEVGGGASCLQE